MPDLQIELLNHTSHKINLETLKDTLVFTLRRLNQIDTVNIELVIVDDQEMITLNNKFRHQNKTTDVLSFENPNRSIEGENSLGSIVISYDQASLQAKQAKLGVNDEINSLVNHGLLHLLGYNHS